MQQFVLHDIDKDSCKIAKGGKPAYLLGIPEEVEIQLMSMRLRAAVCVRGSALNNKKGRKPKHQLQHLLRQLQLAARLTINSPETCDCSWTHKLFILK